MAVQFNSVQFRKALFILLVTLNELPIPLSKTKAIKSTGNESSGKHCSISW